MFADGFKGRQIAMDVGENCYFHGVYFSGIGRVDPTAVLRKSYKTKTVQ
jgi:hypothetical protein